MNYLFIDDERFPPRVLYRPEGNINEEDWKIARNLGEVQIYVDVFGMPDLISFDHDLGKNEPTGKDIANWLVEQDIEGTNLLPDNFDFVVHSMNPIGKTAIEAYLSGYLAFKRTEA